MQIKVKEIFTGNRKTFLIILLIITGTLALYAQVVTHEFVSFDDDLYITQNDQVKSGLSWKNLQYALGFSKVTYWHPLTWLSHMLDCQLFGLNSGIHHLMNVLFHILNSVLLFIVLLKMTGSHWRSAFAAALFALHPVNVDTVAWVAERKNVLSTFFWMLTMLSYFQYTRAPGLYRYILVVCIFILGLLSKPMLVTLPFVLLLMDFWPLQRIRIVFENADRKSKEAKAFRYEGAAVSRLIVEKIPLLIFALAVIVISSLSIRYGGFQIDTLRVPMGLRIENALVSYVLYLGKFLWPTDLTFYYPYPEFVPLWQVIGSGILLITISAAALKYIFRAPYFLIGWLWFLGTLVPVSGIMQGGLWPEIAERWAYVPYIGLFIAVSWGIHDILHGRPWGKKVFLGAAAAVLLVLMVLTFRQIGYWKDDLTLFTHGIEINPKNFCAQNNLGNYYVSKKNYKEAAYRFSEALRMNPTDVKVMENLGRLYYDTGDKDRSIHYYLEALQYNPRSVKASFRLGTIYSERKEFDKATGYFLNVIKQEPEHASAYYNLGVIAAQKGDKEKAAEYLSTAIKLDPRDAESHYSFGIVLMNQGKVNDAISHFRKAIKIDPKNKEAGNSLAMALNLQKKIQKDTLAQLEQRRRKEPDNPELLQKLAVVYAMNGRNADALDALQRFVRIQPDNPDGYYNIACVYAKEGNVDEAVLWLKKSIDKGFKDWNLLQKDEDLVKLRSTLFYKNLVKDKQG
jgi:tetratricopeptide (TPR) repeat protein